VVITNLQRRHRRSRMSCQVLSILLNFVGVIILRANITATRCSLFSTGRQDALDPPSGRSVVRAGAPTPLDGVHRNEIQQAQRLRAVLNVAADRRGHRRLAGLLAVGAPPERGAALGRLHSPKCPGDARLQVAARSRISGFPPHVHHRDAAARRQRKPQRVVFNAMLLNEYEYEHYVDGQPFEYVAAGSKLRTTYTSLTRTYISNTIERPCTSSFSRVTWSENQVRTTATQHSCRQV
jgi:hypothetical protein